MQKKYINVGLPLDLSNKVEEAVKGGKATTKTALIKNAIRKYLEETKVPTITDGKALQDSEGRISGLGVRFVLLSLQVLGLVKKNANNLCDPKKVNELIFNAAKDAGMNTGLNFQRSLGKSGKDAFFAHVKLAKPFGWGRPEIREENGKFIMKYYYSWEAEAYLEAYGKKSNDCVCHISRGLLAGIASVTVGEFSKLEETKCSAKGDPYCQFEVTK